MAKITAIRTGNGKRLHISLDGKFAFSLEPELAERARLRIEQELPESESQKLVTDDRFYRCFKAATRYLGYRPQSEFELKEKLGRHGFDNSTKEAVIAKLKEQGLVNDSAFAQFWVDNR